MTNEEMFKIVEAITYKPGWHIGFHAVAAEPDTEPYIQLEISEESDASLDASKRDGTRTPWKSRRVYLSHHMCRQEIVGAVFGLIDGAERHEMREWFRYRGASIYNPHLDPDVLVGVASRASSFNVRENSMTMEEVPVEEPKLYKKRYHIAEQIDPPGQVQTTYRDLMDMGITVVYFGLYVEGAVLVDPKQ